MGYEKYKLKRQDNFISLFSWNIKFKINLISYMEKKRKENAAKRFCWNKKKKTSRDQKSLKAKIKGLKQN